MNELSIYEDLPDGSRRYKNFWINFVQGGGDDIIQRLADYDIICLEDSDEIYEDPKLVFKTEENMVMFILRWS